MAKKKSVKRLRKGERCARGWERVTIQYGKRTIKACIRKEAIKKQAKVKGEPWIMTALDAVAHAFIH